MTAAEREDGSEAEAGRLVRRILERLQVRDEGLSQGCVEGTEGVRCDRLKMAMHSSLILSSRGTL